MSNLILKKKDAQWTVEKMENNQKVLIQTTRVGILAQLQKLMFQEL